MTIHNSEVLFSWKTTQQTSIRPKKTTWIYIRDTWKPAQNWKAGGFSPQNPDSPWNMAIISFEKKHVISLYPDKIAITTFVARNEICAIPSYFALSICCRVFSGIVKDLNVYTPCMKIVVGVSSYSLTVEVWLLSALAAAGVRWSDELAAIAIQVTFRKRHATTSDCKRDFITNE